MAKAKEEEERQKKEKEEKQKSRKSPQKEKGRKSATSRSSKPVTPSKKWAVHSIKSSLLLYSLYYAETCDEWAGPISALLRLRATQLFLKICRSGGEPLVILCPIWPTHHLNLGPPAPETNAWPLDQFSTYHVSSYWYFDKVFRWFDR